jgi:DNA-binding NarL/FixJ family response regulator
VKILVVDDHPLVRDAMASLLRQLADSVTILEAADCASGLDLAHAHHDIDLVVLDLNLPGIRGFEALDRFHCEQPTLPVVILSMIRDRDTVTQAIKRGAMGFIPKVSAKDVIVNAARLVLSGGVYLPPEVVTENGGMFGPSEILHSARSLSDLGLTPRQGQVLALVMQGKSNKEICRVLGLAERTVKVHVTAVLTALKVSTRTQAVVAANQLGLSADNLWSDQASAH